MEEKVIIRTERLYLREMTPDDREALAAVISDPLTMRYYPCPYDEKGVQRWLDWSMENYRTFGFGLWAVCQKENGRMIGDCGITIQNINGIFRPEIGYHIHSAYQRKGYAGEAVRAVRDWGFENTPFRRLWSYMVAENVPSQATAMSMGMTKDFEYTEDGILHFVYSVSREDLSRGPVSV